MGSCRSDGCLKEEQHSTVDESPLYVVRELHKTIIGLRDALQHSRSELNALKSALPADYYSHESKKECLTTKRLRRKFCPTNIDVRINLSPMENSSTSFTGEKNEEQLDSETVQSLERPDLGSSNLPVLSDSKEDLFENVQQQIQHDASYHLEGGAVKFSSSTDLEEVDHIDIIFTTDDPKNLDVKENLVPILDSTSNSQVDISSQSVLVETDISKCGIVYENSSELDENSHAPVLVRTYHNFEAPLNSGARGSVLDRSLKPVPPNEVGLSVCNSEAQTDITALPLHWKSETSLRTIKNKNHPQLTTTLPSKFVAPSQETSFKVPVKLSAKTKKAGRVLLSDINFTSMVPELSRSVDRLYQAGDVPPTHSGPDLQCDKSQTIFGSSQSRFDAEPSWSVYDDSLLSEQNIPCFEESRYQSQRGKGLQFGSAGVFSSFGSNKGYNEPLSPKHLRRHSTTVVYCPSSLHYSNGAYYFASDGKEMKHKCGTDYKLPAAFGDIRSIRQSMPNVSIGDRSVCGSDCTEALLAESESALRRTLDALMAARRKKFSVNARTHSDTDLLGGGFHVPLTARPFIAKRAEDLKKGDFVKVISDGIENRIVGGKVKYIGILPDMKEPYVGILLSSPYGNGNGSFNGHHLFSCEPGLGLFVPFRKVVMAWKC